MLAATGIGWFPTVDAACREIVTLGEHVEPSSPTDVYRERYAQYRSLYPALAATFHSIR
jgi:sugar (pentulose or hexulose) kinase